MKGLRIFHSQSLNPNKSGTRSNTARPQRLAALASATMLVGWWCLDKVLALLAYGWYQFQCCVPCFFLAALPGCPASWSGSISAVRCVLGVDRWCVVVVVVVVVVAAAAL